MFKASHVRVSGEFEPQSNFFLVISAGHAADEGSSPGAELLQPADPDGYRGVIRRNACRTDRNRAQLAMPSMASSTHSCAITALVSPRKA